jgi:hypothetical protein
VFVYDPRIRGLPAAREQVVSISSSINQPHLAIPGKQAGPAQAFMVSLRGQSGYAVFVYLYLAESRDAAVYVPERRKLTAAELPGEQSDGLAFVESMGFIMDTMNFETLAQAEQEGLMKAVPVFYKDPQQAPGPQAAAEKPEEHRPSLALGRLFASF